MTKDYWNYKSLNVKKEKSFAVSNVHLLGLDKDYLLPERSNDLISYRKSKRSIMKVIILIIDNIEFSRSNSICNYKANKEFSKTIKSC